MGSFPWPVKGAMSGVSRLLSISAREKSCPGTGAGPRTKDSVPEIMSTSSGDLPQHGAPEGFSPHVLLVSCLTLEANTDHN